VGEGWPRGSSTERIRGCCNDPISNWVVEWIDRGYSHRDSDHSVRSIPEANIASVLASSWRIPGHDEKVQLDANVEDDDDVPGLELRLRQVSLLATPANGVDTESHC